MKKLLCALLAAVTVFIAIPAVSSEDDVLSGFTEEQINAYEKRAYYAVLQIETGISAIDLDALKLVYAQRPDDTFDLYLSGFDISLFCNPNAGFNRLFPTIDTLKIGVALGYMKIQIKTREYTEKMLEDPEMYEPVERYATYSVPLVSIDKVPQDAKLDLVCSTYRFIRREKGSYEEFYGKALTPRSYRLVQPHVVPQHFLWDLMPFYLVHGAGAARLGFSDLTETRFVLEPLENGLCRIWGENIGEQLEQVKGKIVPQYDDLDLLLLAARRGSITLHTYKDYPFVMLDDVPEQDRASLTLLYTNEDYVVPEEQDPYEHAGWVIYDKGSEATKNVILAVVRDDAGSARWLYPLDYDLNLQTYKNSKVIVNFLPSDEKIGEYLEAGKIPVMLGYYQMRGYDYIRINVEKELPICEYSDVLNGTLPQAIAEQIALERKKQEPDLTLYVEQDVDIDGLRIGIDPFASSLRNGMAIVGSPVVLLDRDGNELPVGVRQCEIALSHIDSEKYGSDGRFMFALNDMITLRNFLKDHGVLFAKVVNRQTGAVQYGDVGSFDLIEIGKRTLTQFDFDDYDLWLYTSIRDFLPDISEIRIALEYDDEGNAKLYAADKNGDPLPTTIDHGTYNEAVVSLYGMENLLLEPDRCVQTVEKAVRERRLDTVVTWYDPETHNTEVLGYESVPVIVIGEEVTVYDEVPPLASFKLPTTTYTLGDADGDGSVNARDAISLMKYIVGCDVKLTQGAADMNADGKLNSRDVLVLMQTIVNGEEPLHICSACALFGHKVTSTYGTEVVHNAYETSPHCRKDTYLVISCTRDGCGYIRRSLEGSVRIASCHG